MLELAQVKPQDNVVDLGSGDGRIIVMAAKEFGSSCVGIEADPFRVMWSRFVIRMRGLKDKVKVIWGNFFSQNVAYATVVTVYQGPEVNKLIREKLSAELKPGTRVVSYKFPLEGWAPVETTTKPDIYLYITE